MSRYVLVVDDHPMNLKLMQTTLQLQGITSRTARSAEEAATLIEAEVPALILMDVQLPKTDGLTFTRQLRADPRYAKLPIVAVTAYAMATDEQAAHDAGCDAYVSKPIDVMGLGRLVRRLLGEEQT